MNRNYDELLLISLARITFLSVAEKLKLLKNLGNALEFSEVSKRELEFFLKRDFVSSWNGKENLLHAKNELAIIKSKGIKFLLYGEENYPMLLRQIYNAPFLLFYRGNPEILDKKSVSMVGTRNIVPEAKKAAIDFAYNAVCDGCSVISGLAYGIDFASHSGAVNAFYDNEEISGRTIAVLPCGCDTVVPRGNVRLAQKILDTGGCLLSEYVPCVLSEPWRYVQRNRIIASLSLATVVLQAPIGSGALITAEYALEYGRDLFFHEVCFSENSKKIDELKRRKLNRLCEVNPKKKIETVKSVESFLFEGAPVIKNYEDYCKALLEVPGERSKKIVQYELFEKL